MLPYLSGSQPQGNAYKEINKRAFWDSPVMLLLLQTVNIMRIRKPKLTTRKARCWTQQNPTNAEPYTSLLPCICIRKPKLTTPTALRLASCMSTTENCRPLQHFSGSCSSHCRGLARTPNKNAFRENEVSRTSTASRREARTPSRAFAAL